MAALWDALPASQRGAYARSSAELVPLLLAALNPGDTVLVKGSFGARMALIIDALRAPGGIRRMLYYLSLLPHADRFALFRLFRYLTFRSGGAVVTALFFAFLIGPPLIVWLKVRQGKGQPIRSDGPRRHIVEKQGTPTMGGLLILIPWTVSTLLWANLSNKYVWIVLLVVTLRLMGCSVFSTIITR